ncbi:type IV secretion system DNA-binding domain-containing protein, partial [Sphingobium sp. D43FB]|uniref:type IV secretion system DNA-binding domain-containing protein n=1 Tax=Sphingobium sp. D43FB TaxID=2017595 RepID=UPI000BD2B6B8
VEQVEANEGMSYGVNDMRDGVNLSRMQVTRPLVMSTEVTNLPNLVGFLRFGRNLPVVRFDSRFNNVPSLGPAFLERTTPPIQIDKAGMLVRIAHAEARVREAMEREATQASPPATHGEIKPAKPSVSSEAAPTAPPQPDLFTPPAPNIDPRVEDILLNDENAELPVPARTLWTILAGKQGEIRSDLVQHGRDDGPRERARPA